MEHTFKTEYIVYSLHNILDVFILKFICYLSEIKI